MCFCRMQLGMTMQTMYPERMYRCFVVNAPSFFAMLWRVMDPLLTERVKRKISIFRTVRPAAIRAAPAARLSRDRHTSVKQGSALSTGVLQVCGNAAPGTRHDNTWNQWTPTWSKTSDVSARGRALRHTRSCGRSSLRRTSSSSGAAPAHVQCGPRPCPAAVQLMHQTVGVTQPPCNALSVRTNMHHYECARLQALIYSVPCVCAGISVEMGTRDSRPRASPQCREGGAAAGHPQPGGRLQRQRRFERQFCCDGRHQTYSGCQRAQRQPSYAAAPQTDSVVGRDPICKEAPEVMRR